MTSKDLPSFMPSREWGSGAMPCASLGGLTTAQFGQALVHANLSAREARALGLLTSGICGPLSSTSSRLADRSASLANRLRAVSDALGSTLYRLTWKVQITPAGQSLYALRASAPRTRVTVFTGWVTPSARDHKGDRSSPLAGRTTEALPYMASLAGWPTPTTPSGGQVPPAGTTATGRTLDGRKVQVTLKDVANLAGWETPQARDHFPAHTPEYVAAKKAQGHGMANLNDQVQLVDLGPARLTASGEMLIGYIAPTDCGDQLNPAHSRWIMGLPREWDDYAPPGTPSTRKSRRISSAS